MTFWSEPSPATSRQSSSSVCRSAQHPAMRPRRRRALGVKTAVMAVEATKGYCTESCARFDHEFERLQALYQAAGDPTLSRDAWLFLVESADAWNV
jgi:hypothetical protein